MKCPKCGYGDLFNLVIDGDTPCIACGYDMDGVVFYNEATSEYIEVSTGECGQD